MLNPCLCNVIYFPHKSKRLFIIIIIFIITLFSGVDDVFVFINVFRQADHIKGAGPRVWFTMVTAGKATFFTSFTTAAAFAANIASMVCTFLSLQLI